MIFGLLSTADESVDDILGLLSTADDGVNDIPGTWFATYF